MNRGLISITILALVIVLAGCAGTQSPQTGALPTAEKVNLRFLISDDVNAIGDFDQLRVTISEIGVKQRGESGNETGKWLVLPPEVEELDLRQLQGEKAQVIWSGNVTAGEYTKVFIYVDEVWGILTGGDERVDIKLPSNKLHISKPFVVTDDSVTSFVYDITVIAAGNEKNGVKYILKPQIAESGADKEFEEVDTQAGKPGKSAKLRNRLRFQVEGYPAPGAEVTLTVTQEGSPVEGATVSINGEEVGTTDAEGRLTLLLPDAPGEVKIRASLGAKSGEMELDLEEPGEAPDE